MINDDIVNGITDVITEREEKSNPPEVIAPAVEKPKTEEKKEEAPELTEQQKAALSIENDLAEMFASGKKDWDLDSIISASKAVYNILFDTYNESEENGIVTNKFSLMESKPSTKIFTLNKK
jgi:hypothetical protein